MTATAAIVTIGNELVSGDVPNTNGSWLAQRLEAVGVSVRLIAAIPDDLGGIAAFLNAYRPEVDHLLVTGGLGGTPDDLTREAVALTFTVPQVEQPALTADLQARFSGDPEFVRRWAMLPEGSAALTNPLGGAPGFRIENVWVLPGLPAEMEAMFLAIEAGFAGPAPIRSWRHLYRTKESHIVQVLEMLERLHPTIAVGSYPRFDERGAEVEVVLKSRDADALAAAVAWFQPEVERAVAERA